MKKQRLVNIICTLVGSADISLSGHQNLGSCKTPPSPTISWCYHAYPGVAFSVRTTLYVTAVFCLPEVSLDSCDWPALRSGSFRSTAGSVCLVFLPPFFMTWAPDLILSRLGIQIVWTLSHGSQGPKRRPSRNPTVAGGRGRGCESEVSRAPTGRQSA